MSLEKKKVNNNNKTKEKPKAGTQKKGNSKVDTIKNEIIGIIILFIGVFLIYTFFSSDSGVVGNAINSTILFFIGSVGIISFGITAIIFGAYLVFKFRPFEDMKSSFFLLGILIHILVMLHINDPAYIDFEVLNPQLYSTVFENGARGGVVGIVLANVYTTLFSATGSYILCSFVILLLTLLVFKNQVVLYARKQKILREKEKEEKLAIKEDLLKEEIKERQEKIRNKQLNKTNVKASANTPIPTNPYDEMVKNEEILKEGEKKKEENSSPIIKTYKEYLKNKKTSREDQEEASEDVVEKLDNAKKEEVNYKFPPVSLLVKGSDKNAYGKKEEILSNSSLLEQTLDNFSIGSKVSQISVGPTVTRYELQLNPGIRVSKVVNLADDIAMSLAAGSVRIEAPIPGKSAIGIEVPNKDVSVVHFRELMESEEFKKHPSKVAIGLGKNITGDMLIMDIAKLPHLLIAGATGSGKSVCINAVISSILYHSSPEDVKLILIDPKMVELSVYNGIPHLMIPVVTDPKQAAGALNWAVKEMQIRYDLFAQNRVRDITGYNKKALENGEEKMSQIVLVIDELADLMMVCAREVEAAICRLAQLARAAGIHLVLATQRPSVDVITGLIKANIPSRISFSVSSQIDSRTILDASGAEKLLGNGDMLYYPAGSSKPERAQCAYISDSEVEKLVDFVKEKQKVIYNEKVLDEIVRITPDDNKVPVDTDMTDTMLNDSIKMAFELGEISTSMLQRRLRIGYARAGRIIDEMESMGIISAKQGSKPRKVLIKYDDFFGSIEDNAREDLEYEQIPLEEIE